MKDSIEKKLISNIHYSFFKELEFIFLSKGQNQLKIKSFKRYYKLKK